MSDPILMYYKQYAFSGRMNKTEDGKSSWSLRVIGHVQRNLVLCTV